MFVGFRAQPDFFYFNLGLRFTCFTFLFSAFVEELTKIHNTADRGCCSGSYFNQVLLSFTCHAEGLLDAAGHMGPELAGFERELSTGWLRRVGAGDVVAQDELDG